MLMDEKGLSVVLAFGLPDRTHEDDAARAVRAALGIHESLRALDLTSSAGITSGVAFCAVCGNDTRRAYTMAGSTINMAARLMQAAATGVLCDAQTAERASMQAGLAFSRVPSLVPRGKSEAISVYRPTLGPSVQAPAKPAVTNRLIGRRNERRTLDRALGSLVDDKRGGLIVIEGEAGVGKSRLVRHFLDQVRDAGVRWFSGGGAALDRSVHYHALQPIFRHLFELDTVLGDVDARREGCLRRLAAHAKGAELARFAPLLNGVLSFDFPETDLTSSMQEVARAEQVQELLLCVLQEPEAPTPTVLIIEDAHWLDSMSASFLAQASRRLPELLMVITTRHPDGSQPVAFSQLTNLADQRLVLGPLDREETRALLCDHLRIESLPATILPIVEARARGNALFSIEFARALRDHGVIVVAGDRCILAPEVRDVAKTLENVLATKGLPGTLQGIVTSRIDRLDPQHRLLLKVASAIGQPFSLPLLSAVFPPTQSQAHLETVVEELVDLGLLGPDAVGLQARYRFCHVLIQETVYQGIPFSQRRGLHRAVAEWYERHLPDGLTHPVLAHHWRLAGDARKAQAHLEQAGIEALRAYANEEAVRFFSEALDLLQSERSDKRETVQKRRRRAVMELNLGRAHVNISGYAEARQWLESGLLLEGRPVPRFRVGVILGLLKEVAGQIIHRLFVRHFMGRCRHARDDLLRQAHAYEGLIETYFNLGENALCLYSALRSLNLAELAGVSAELARGYASFGAILGFVPLNKAARDYCRRGISTAREINDLSAQAWVTLATGVLEAGGGHWQVADTLFAESATIAKTLGDGRRCDDSSENQAAVRYLQGDISGSLDVAGLLVTSAQRRNDRSKQADALRRKAYCALAFGQVSAAADLVDQLAEIRRAEATKPFGQKQIDHHVLRGLLCLRRNEYEESHREAMAAVQILSSFAPMFYDVILDYSSLAEICLALKENKASNGIDLARLACKRLRGFARSFPVARPARDLWAGLALWLSGERRRAMAAWASTLEHSKALRLTYFEALAHYQIGRHLEKGDVRRIEHLSEAGDLLQSMGEQYYFFLVQRELGPSGVDFIPSIP